MLMLPVDTVYYTPAPYLRRLLRTIPQGPDALHWFYLSGPWRRRRVDVLALDHGECVYCKAHNRYRKATEVHHVQHLRARPDLALSIWYEDEQGRLRRNLVSLCRACHEAQHPERSKTGDSAPAAPLTPERW